MSETQIYRIIKKIIGHLKIEQKYELSKKLAPLINREQRRGGINSSDDRYFIVMPITNRCG